MAGKQELECPVCKVKFFFDPKSDENVIVSLNESLNIRKKIGTEEKIVTAYLECPNGHTNPYKVKKDY